MAKAGGYKEVKFTLQLTHFYIPKKQGQGLRIIQDFRELNQYKYSTKEITKCIGDIGRANIFTTLDLTWGFWQMKLDEKSQDTDSFHNSRQGSVSLNYDTDWVAWLPSQFPKAHRRST